MRDERAELVVAPDAEVSRGNDLWVMKYVGKFPTGTWQHMAPIPNHPMNADIDCSGREFAAKFAIAGDFDADRVPSSSPHRTRARRAATTCGS